jgi:ChrB-like protein
VAASRTDHEPPRRPPARSPARWVLLTYRLPREPSTPRITVWRRLERLGVARLGDGLVALPADRRTREQMDWLAQEIQEAGGEATVWLATPARADQEQPLIDALQASRAQEYRELLRQAHEATQGPPEERARTLTRLRSAARQVDRRDFFTTGEREQAHAAIAALAQPETARSGRAR